jgi:hypothetical protein
MTLNLSRDLNTYVLLRTVGHTNTQRLAVYKCKGYKINNTVGQRETSVLHAGTQYLE